MAAVLLEPGPSGALEEVAKAPKQKPYNLSGFCGLFFQLCWPDSRISAEYGLQIVVALRGHYAGMLLGARSLASKTIEISMIYRG